MKIAVVTGARAEYGLLYWVMKEIDATPDLELCLIATGAHLEARFGFTYKAIEADGFRIDDKVNLEIAGDRPIDIAHAMGLGIVRFVEAFERHRPDLMMVLGDRYELLAAAQAAMLTRLPIAHLHGGELTEGAMDDAMRHSLTKLSHLHFTATEQYRKRVIQLGEDPARVFNVGATGIDNIVKLSLPALDELSTRLGIDLEPGYFLVTYHPVTLGTGNPTRPLAALLEVLDRYPNFKVVVTGVNADPGNRSIAELLERYAATNPDRVRLALSLGQRLYLGAMKHCRAVVGNSSSGIIEAPAFPVPTVNIGTRQRGRIRTVSIIDCGEDELLIAEAVRRALSDEFHAGFKDMVSPYGSGGASRRIVEVIRRTPLAGILDKRFYDWPEPDRL